jgi:hypothetical protein
MLLETSPIHFSREDAARTLHLPQGVIDALVNTGAVETLSAAALERLLRDTLLRLYRAEARADEVEIEIALPEGDVADEPDTEVVRQSLSDYQTEAQRQRENQRIVPRYKPRRQLGGMFRQVRFAVVQISESGLRIRHDETLRPGDEARLTFSLVQPARTFALKARVVWTSIAQRGNGPSFCISGLRAIAGEEQLQEAIRLLLAVREAELDQEEAKPKVPTFSALPDDDVAAIIRTMRMLLSDPVEANRWYTRARFALADEQIRAAAPVRARDREEALAVWEYLGRRVDLKAVAGVLAWIRSTRSTAAAPATY